MRFIRTVASLAILLSCLTSISFGDLVWGTISNFQDGTVQGWSGGTVSNVPNSGPMGSGDNSLLLSNGTPGNFAMFNTGVNGAISSAVTEIMADIRRDPAAGSAEIRLVLFDTSGTRWTSTTAANVIDDGNWNRHVFSILETDLTRVLGSGTYLNLTTNLERILFRYDPGTPSSGGFPLSGTMNFDNIMAVPEPCAAIVLALSGLGLAFRRRRIAV